MPDTNYPQGTFCWNELATRDAAAARKFYTELLNWDTKDVEMGPGGTYTLILIDKKDIGGMYQMSGDRFEGVPPHWMSYVHVDDVDKTAAKVGNLGGTVLQEPMDIPDVGRMAVIKDPTGAVIALFKGGAHSGADKPKTGLGTFCWNELATRDAASSTDFYTKLLGWKAKVEKMGSTDYTVFMAGEKMAGGMYALTAEQGDAPPHWLSYITVEDCDAAASRVPDLGGKIVVPPQDIPGVGRFTMICDPTGAMVSLIRLNNSSS